MTATPIASPTASSTPGDPIGRIDASCRNPVVFLFAKAAGWLVLGSVLACIASVKIHAPYLLADWRWLTYGRLQPAAMNSFLYGFALQAGVGVGLWIICRLGRTTLVQPGIALIGATIWNFGVFLGVFGILAGDGTGYEWLEMPRYASPILLSAYALIGVCALLTFHGRREPRLYVSQWFLLAAWFWFPWIYSTANLLLVFAPVRGVLQSVVNWWYMNHLTMIEFGLIGLATIFYFIPKLVGRPLHSLYQAMFAFWTLILFAGWVGIPHGAPVPAWIPGVSTVFSVLTLVPMTAVAFNLHQTIAGRYAELGGNKPLLFISFGAAALLVGALLWSWASVPYLSRVVRFTFFTPAQTQLLLYGFTAMTLFGAIYYITPRIAQIEWPSARLINWHFWLSGGGLTLYFLALAIGGILQGQGLNNPGTPFLEALRAGLRLFRIGTLGEVLMALGNLSMALNLSWVLLRYCKTCCVTRTVVATKPELAEVRA
jgi:cytochrome c oxidase cbb3-type subunit 1